MRIIDLLFQSASAHPRLTAVVDKRFALSYRQMLAVVEKLSKRLKAVGCEKSIKVAIILGNSLEYLVSFFAVSASGGIIVPLSNQMTVLEVSRLLESTGVSIVITDRSYAKKLLGLPAPSTPPTILCVRCNKEDKLVVETLRSSKFRINEDDGDVALMIPTSGTTGGAKIVMLTDDQLLSNMAVYRLMMGFDKHNRVYCALPFHHIYSICAQVLTHISLSDTLVISSGPFFVKDFIKTIEKYRITATAFVPYMAILLSEYEGSPKGIGSLKYVTLSGAKTPSSTYRLLAKKYPWINFINTYGMTEAGSRISIAAPFPGRFPINSVGRAMPGVTVKIVAEDGAEVPRGGLGQILVKSPGVMKGYYKDPELTANTIIGGWLRTGDLGKMDEAGNLYILGRMKELIISGGENICPVEIEDVLCEHPAVREAVVVGRKDRLLGEVPCALVLKREDFTEQTTEEALMKFCRSRLSSHKIPRFIHFVKKLPRLGSSKIDRRAVKKLVDGAGVREILGGQE